MDAAIGPNLRNRTKKKARSEHRWRSVPSWLAIAALCIPATPAFGKVDAFRVITSQLLRPEVLIVLDTSGSMAVAPGASTSSSNIAGGDCGGDRSGTVDICGDGLCSGLENGSSCGADCNISGTSTSAAGSSRRCKNGSDPDTQKMTRMFMIKRVLRLLLPQLRTAASFGLVTFHQQANSGGDYFQYYKARPVSGSYPTKQVTTYLPLLMMKDIDAWVNKKPAPSVVGFGGITNYALLSTTGLTGGDSLYARSDDPTIQMRFNFATAGRAYKDGGFKWRYLGSYYVYDQRAIDTGSKIVVPEYRGPQYVDAINGQTYVYRKFTYLQGFTASDQGISASTNGKLAVSLAEIDKLNMSQGAVNKATRATMADILTRLSDADSGGIHAVGGTPTGYAIDAARSHFLDRKNGTGPFVSADGAAGCRPRFLLVLTDGESNGPVDPATAAKNLYNNAAFAGNEIKTIVVGLPGLPSSAKTELDNIASAGDNGNIGDGSAGAYFAGNEAELIDAIKTALYEKILGDYTTTAPGTATAATSTVLDNVALITSTEFPGWRGHLRAIDMTAATPSTLWDAGDKLAARDYKTRLIYTGHTTPILMMKPNGTTTTGMANQIRNVWPASPPSAAKVKAFIEDLAGKNRPWRLGAIVRSIPAVVGPPPSISAAIPSHASYETGQEKRQRIVYVESGGTGLLHAFDATTGEELYAYMPPALLKKAFKLYKADGQDEDPAEFSWLAANPPRVEDIPDGAGGWSTQLVMTLGPGGEDFVVLDITEPSVCTGDPCEYEINDPPFSIVAASSQMAPSVSSTFGQTWSLPAFYYNSELMVQAAMGSGYEKTAGSLEGRYYNLFTTLSDWSTAIGDHQSYLLNHPVAPLPKLKDKHYTVLADTVAAIDSSPGMNWQVVATYQADLHGRITRFEKGQTTGLPAPTVVLESTGNAEGKHPFHYAPAVMHREGLSVTFAAASGAFEEAHGWMANNNFKSRFYMRTEIGGAVSAQDMITCSIQNLCTSCFDAPFPAACADPPSSAALPMGRPLIVENTTTQAVEAFYLYYDPPTQQCKGNDIAVGDSHLIRVSSDLATGSMKKLVSLKNYPSKLVTGMTIVGGGVEIAVSVTGRGGGTPASVERLTNAPLTTGSGSGGGAPVLEGFMEVR